jgi:hypothetical protein
MLKRIGPAILASVVLLQSPPAAADDVIAASRRGDLFAVKHYLRKLPDSVGARDGFRYTPLHWAAVQGHWDVVEALVEGGADVNAVGGDGGTPLHLAAHHDRPDMIRQLLDEGADLTIQNRWGRTPLHVAARRNCDLVATLLLSRAGLSLRRSRDHGRPGGLPGQRRPHPGGVDMPDLSRGRPVSVRGTLAQNRPPPDRDRRRRELSVGVAWSARSPRVSDLL